MTGLSGIIRTKIVNKKLDAFWDEIPPMFQPVDSGVLVITQSYMPGSSEEIQLKKMLTACGLPEEKYNVIQLSEGQNISWHRLRDKVNPKVVILLGILPEQLGISAMFHLYKPNNFNGCIWIAGLSLTELENNPDAKRQLWQEGLKPVLVDK